jgi:hypothetical protein
VGCGGKGSGGPGGSGGSGNAGGSGAGGGGAGGGGPIVLPAASCQPAPGGGRAQTAAPVMKLLLANGGDEGWLGSPAVADLDGDGKNEIVAARDAQVVVWNADGSVRGKARLPGSRIWAAPLVGNFIGDAKLEIVAASRGTLGMFTADLQPAPGFPVTWRDEMRSLAAGDLDGDGKLEIVAGTTNDLDANGQTDIFDVFRADGTMQPGFPANTTGTSGCDSACYTHAGFDQNLAVGPVDAEGGDDVFLPQDNAYISVHKGTGVAFDSNPIFRERTKILGVRFLHDYAEAQQGYANDEATALQAHFTNTPGALADLDGDGQTELVMVGSVQNAAQTNRQLGVALWVIHKDGTRPAAWTAPFYVPAYLAGLDDLGGNIVGLTNQVSIADIDPAAAGLEMVFAGYDGKIHAVTADRQERWTYAYTTDPAVLTGGVAVADLSGDGVPEIVFTTYSTDDGKSALVVLDAGGNLQQKVALPGRGAMAVPTIADVDGDGTLEIVVSLKDGDAATGSLQVFAVPGSAPNCLLWPTGRANLLRSGYVRRAP